MLRGLKRRGGVIAFGAFVLSHGVVEFVLPAKAAGLVDDVGVVICAGVATGFFVAVCDGGPWPELLWFPSVYHFCLAGIFLFFGS